MKRTEKYPTTATYKFENRNPKGRLTTGDCVYRAISLATGKDWCKVVMELAEQACETAYCPNSRSNYGLYLERNGFRKYPQPRHANGTKYTVREFCHEHKHGVFVVNIANHTFTVVNGRVRDTWDCSKYDSRVGNYWKKTGVGE